MKRTFPREHCLFWHHAGPKVSYCEDIAGTYLVIADRNPEKEIMFYMSPTELLIFAIRCIWRSFVR